MSSTYSRMMRYLQTAECMEEMTRLYGSRDGVLCAQATRYSNASSAIWSCSTAAKSCTF